MKKTSILILLLSILIPTLALAQKKGKGKARKKAIVTVTDTISPPLEIIELKPHKPVEIDRGPVIEPVPQIPLFFRVTNTERIDNIYAYFYCPQMEDSTFVYPLELGSDNNLSGGKYRDESQGYITIPQKYYAGREIRFKADGYKTARVSIDNIAEKDTITATLERDTYEYVIVYEKKRNKWDASFLPNINDKFFYGKCKPILYKDGNHADPACAFGGTGANRYVNEKAVLGKVLTTIEGLDKRLIKKAKKGRFTLYLRSPGDKDKNPKEFAADIQVLEENLNKLFPNGAKINLTFRIWKGK